LRRRVGASVTRNERNVQEFVRNFEYLAMGGAALARGGPNQEKSMQAMESFLELL